MALATIILAHRGPEQLRRLVNVLAVRENTVALHVDIRAAEAVWTVARQMAEENKRVKLVRRRAVGWGQFSLVAAQLDGMRRLLEPDVPTWTHAHLISAQDFPLRSQADMERDLGATPDVSFMSSFDPASVWTDAERRIRHFYLDAPRLSRVLYLPGIGRRLRTIFGFGAGVFFIPRLRRSPPRFFKWMGGSNHATLSRRACAYIVSDPTARRIVDWLRYTLIPDESVFQSVLLNSGGKFEVVSDDRREIVFPPGSPNPKVLTIEDWPLLERSRKLFARKFDLAVDAAVIDRLEQRLREP